MSNGFVLLSGTNQLNSKNNNNNNRDSVPNRAASPSVTHSSIPTPGGRSLGAPRSQSEKHPSRATSSNSSTSSVPVRSASQKLSPTNKNSMLDKFKFFNSKEKDKSKSGLKSSSKSSGGASKGDSADASTDTKASAGANARSAPDAGASGTSGSSSPKGAAKGFGKKSLGRPSSGKRDSLSTEDSVFKRNSPSPSPQNRTPSPSQPPPPAPKKSGGKSEYHKSDTKTGQISPTSTRKGGGKLGSLIPKNHTAKISKSSSSLSSSSSQNFGPAAGSQTAGPASTGIPKAGSSTAKTSSKITKEEKPKGAKDHNKALYSGLPGVASHKGTVPMAAGKPTFQLLPPAPSQGKLEHVPYVRDAPKVKLPSNAQTNKVSDSAMSSGRDIARSVPVPVPKLLSSTIPKGMKEGITLCTTQTVNVVRPTCTTAPNNQKCVNKCDSNTQTTISALQRAVSPVSRSSSLKDSSSQSLSSEVSTGNSDSNPSSNSHSGSGGTSTSSGESVIFRPSGGSCDELSGSEKLLTNSPRLGTRILSSQLIKPGPNVAIVQPRSGEKVETTFDSEVKTEKVRSAKETTFSEKFTTFVDDAGQPIDIKPMPPIMRAMPYGYFRGFSGTVPPKSFHLPGISTPTTLYANSASSRLGVNRPFIDPNRLYSNSMKRTISNCNNVLESDYSSDADTYDYISGYMSDGDILKSNRVEDMTSGYISEGGASLYARRMQQRFREGMQAVKECMQNSTGINDYDR